MLAVDLLFVDLFVIPYEVVLALLEFIYTDNVRGLRDSLRNRLPRGGAEGDNDDMVDATVNAQADDPATSYSRSIESSHELCQKSMPSAGWR